MYLNNLELMGYVGSDPEQKTVGDKALAKFALAVSRGRDSDTLWVDCDVWGKQAEVALKYVKKGMPLYVRGTLNMRRVKQEDESFRTFVSCSVFDFQMLGSKGDVSTKVKSNSKDAEEGKDGGIPF
jgi:single-strand DNA-binding protein